MSMFCYQCEQAAKGTGCTASGVCGKDPRTAALQDLLVHALKELSWYAHRARKLGAKDREIDVFTMEALFSTVTNVNFDPERISELINRAVELKEKALKLYEKACVKKGLIPEHPPAPSPLLRAGNTEELIRQGERVSIEKRKEFLGEDITGLQELLLYGLKGMCAYADHAMILGRESEEVYAFIHETLDFLAQAPRDAQELLDWNLRCGEVNLKVMEMLDAANTGAYGHPVPVKVRTTPLKGKAVLVSGHDLRDLEELLKQTEGMGINIYTHGEMLPAHGYPALKKYRHLAGNYGGAWQDQQKEFAKFPGPVLMTTNCIQKPMDVYKGRVFTSGLVAWPGMQHIAGRNFTPVIKSALNAEGFREDGPEKTITVGFAHNAVLGAADKVISAVKSGKIRHFFLIGGCDGAKSGRNYYTDFAKAVPKDCAILTLACGKYRFNSLDFGDIGGIPRLLDCGQCNDAYSAIKIASALAEAFGCGINELPLSLILSWYEQKAVCILLTLLRLGMKNIRLGPSLPAFVTPAALKILAGKFNIMAVTTAEKDLDDILGTKVGI